MDQGTVALAFSTIQATRLKEKVISSSSLNLSDLAFVSNPGSTIQTHVHLLLAKAHNVRLSMSKSGSGLLRKHDASLI